VLAPGDICHLGVILLAAAGDGQGSLTLLTGQDCAWGPIERLRDYRAKLASETALVLLPAVLEDLTNRECVHRGVDSVAQAISSICDGGEHFYRFDCLKPQLSVDLDLTYRTLLSKRVWAEELIVSLSALPGLNDALERFVKEAKKLLVSVLSFISCDVLALRNLRAIEESWETLRVQALSKVHRRIENLLVGSDLDGNKRRLEADLLLRLADTVNAALECSGVFNSKPLEEYITFARQYDLVNSSARELRAGLPHEELAIELLRFLSSEIEAFFLALERCDDEKETRV